MKYTINEFVKKLPLPADPKWKNGVWDLEAMRQGKISLIIFAPQETDYQTFHEEDEFYFIARGQGELMIGEERFICEVGDAFFVPAGAEHHFENFSADFVSWAVFF